MSPENCQLLEDFAAWLRKSGCTLMPLKQWEALRWETPMGDGARIMYTDKKGSIGRRFGGVDGAQTNWTDFLLDRRGARPTALVYDDSRDLTGAFEMSLEGCYAGDPTLRELTAEAVASFGRQAQNLAQGAALQGLRLCITSTTKGVHVVVQPTDELLQLLKGNT